MGFSHDSQKYEIEEDDGWAHRSVVASYCRLRDAIDACERFIEDDMLDKFTESSSRQEFMRFCLIKPFYSIPGLHADLFNPKEYRFQLGTALYEDYERLHSSI